jgi:sulfur-oxidizing protein SoxX
VKPGLAALIGFMAAAAASGIAGAEVASKELASHDAAVETGAMSASLTGVKGDAARGRAIVVSRQLGLCLLCHSGPFEEERFQGNLAPDLRGAGSRSSEAVLRQRIADSGRLNPGSIMPAYYRTEGLVRVAAAYQGKPVLSAQQVEDVVAFLASLRD